MAKLKAAKTTYDYFRDGAITSLEVTQVKMNETVSYRGYPFTRTI